MEDSCETFEEKSIIELRARVNKLERETVGPKHGALNPPKVLHQFTINGVSYRCVREDAGDHNFYVLEYFKEGHGVDCWITCKGVPGDVTEYIIKQTNKKEN